MQLNNLNWEVIIFAVMGLFFGMVLSTQGLFGAIVVFASMALFVTQRRKILKRLKDWIIKE